MPRFRSRREGAVFASADDTARIAACRQRQHAAGGARIHVVESRWRMGGSVQPGPAPVQSDAPARRRRPPPSRPGTGTNRRLTTRRRNRTFQAGGFPAVAGFEDRSEGRQTPHGYWGLIAGGTKKGTNGCGTVAPRQLTGTAPLRNAVLPMHKASSRVRCTAINVNPELGNHRPILRPGSARSPHEYASH